MASERMTLVRLIGVSPGLAEYGRQTPATMIARIKHHAACQKAEAERVLSAPDDAFRVETYGGVYAKRNVEVLQAGIPAADRDERRISDLAERMRAEAKADRPTGHVEIAHDGFAGDIIGHYTTREGKRGVVVQQDGTRVVHVYGEKWIAAKTHSETSDGR